ncbi:hypothetical protein CERSUDRAFT_76988 [Gelatoporia subvermispora B]|uniref:Uncharacterized protein n=1 Tax=Ceriporiopsis subvermispora (strain B) TaxID=914234 RepID=M2Q7Z8_CERS8|nr:hypothetical protein CERSUDRAFT_76988 [Gelatoporia subvermispora B]
MFVSVFRTLAAMLLLGTASFIAANPVAEPEPLVPPNIYDMQLPPTCVGNPPKVFTDEDECANFRVTNARQLPMTPGEGPPHGFQKYNFDNDDQVTFNCHPHPETLNLAPIQSHGMINRPERPDRFTCFHGVKNRLETTENGLGEELWVGGFSTNALDTKIMSVMNELRSGS